LDKLLKLVNLKAAVLAFLVLLQPKPTKTLDLVLVFQDLVLLLLPTKKIVALAALPPTLTKIMISALVETHKSL
jgi:hypothetical protein